jgi:hypothetical protein
VTRYAAHAMLIPVTEASAQIQWGDVGTWVGGAATAVALVLTWLLLRITRREQKAIRAEQHRVQARQVAAWCDRVNLVPDSGLHEVTVTVQNSSDLPIYSVMVAVGTEWSSTKVQYTELDLSYVIPPKYRKKHTALLQLGRLIDGSYESSPPVEIIFNDASSDERFWWRDRYGALTQLSDKLPSDAAQHFFAAVSRRHRAAAPFHFARHQSQP